jgi:hypothetical protein
MLRCDRHDSIERQIPLCQQERAMVKADREDAFAPKECIEVTPKRAIQPDHRNADTAECGKGS